MKTEKTRQPDICSLLKQGEILEITPIGSSMFPLFDKQRDQAVVKAADISKLRRGDVVLYQRENGMLVLHRIWKIKEGSFYMVGDNQTEVEGPILAEQVKGIMISFCKKGHRVSVKNPVYVCLSRSWLLLRPFRHMISRPIGKLYRFISGKK